MTDTTTSAVRAKRRRLRKDAALKRAEILLEVSRRCAARSDLDSVLFELVTLTSRALDCDRGTLFLNDPTTGELYSHVAQGDLKREIRILNNSGIAGHVFQSGEPIHTEDPYSDPRFNSSIDERTGYKTRNIICVPVRTMVTFCADFSAAPPGRELPWRIAPTARDGKVYQGRRAGMLVGAANEWIELVDCTDK